MIYQGMDEDKIAVYIARLERERKADHAALRALMERIAQTLKSCSDERYDGMQRAQQEAEKWKGEGDMYGWNFHQGMSSGMHWADIIYHRIGRELDALKKEHAAAIQRAQDAKG